MSNSPTYSQANEEHSSNVNHVGFFSPPNISCFSCLYLNDLNQEQGPTSCLDPFEAVNIPVVQCAGPCAVSIPT